MINFGGRILNFHIQTPKLTQLIMKNSYKCLVIIAIATMTMSITADAQEMNDKAAGLNFLINSTRNIIGIGAKYRYNITKPLRVESSFNYLFNNNLENKWDLFENVHLLIPLHNRTKIYPLAGLGILQKRKNNHPIFEDERNTYDDSDASVFWAFNLGGGIDYKISDKLTINAELIQKSSDNLNYTYISTSIIYRF